MARREKRLEKKRAKRTEKKRQVARVGAMGVAEQMARAASAPVLECLLFESGEDDGIAELLISRRLRTGEVAVAVFLVDMYCLGLKNGFARLRGIGDYRSMVEKLEEHHWGSRKLDPPSARRLVEDAVAYARKYGFEPHADARKGLPLLGDIDPALAKDVFEFGHDGKPFYIAGPHDSPEKQRMIFETLRRTAGDGNFDFLLAVGAGDLPSGGIERLDSNDLEELEEGDLDAEETADERHEAAQTGEALSPRPFVPWRISQD